MSQLSAVDADGTSMGTHTGVWVSRLTVPHRRQMGRGQRSSRDRDGTRKALTPTSIPDRVPEKETVSRAMYPLARSRGHLWAHSPEPLRQPLLKRVHANTELWDVTCQIFIDILPQPACPSSMPSPWAWTLPSPQEGLGLTGHKAGTACSS